VIDVTPARSHQAQKFPNRLRVGAARVPAANVGSEEFPETGPAVVAGRDNQAGDQ
jgi:hypothetical protein